MVPPTGIFSSLQGAFQPKASNPLDVVPGPGAMPRPLIQKEARLLDSAGPTPKKPGKWCAMHVHIAWQVYHHQQKIKKQMQNEPHKLDFGLKPEFLSRPSGSGFLGMIQQPRDLPRPATIFSNAGPTHPPVSPYGYLPHPHSNLHTPPSHHDPLNKPPSFGGLGILSSTAFGGLGNPTLTPSSTHGGKDGKAATSSGGPQEPWNRLQQTPSSFPTPPAWPRAPEPERTLEKRESLLNKDEHERDTKEKLSGRQQSPARTSPLVPKQTVETPKVASPGLKDKDRSRERVQSHDPPPQNLEAEDQRYKESQLEKREKMVKCDQHPADARSTSEDPLSPKQQRIRAEGRSSEGPQWEPDAKRIRVEAEQSRSSHVKVKEERRELQDSPEVRLIPKSLEKSMQERRTPGIPPSPLSSIPVPMGMAGYPHSLDRTRLMAPFVGMNPLPSAERFAYSPQHWDPIRNMCRGQDMPPKDYIAKELLLRADPLQRVYPREPFFHPLALEQQQRCQLEERQRLALLREESERSRLLALHHHATLETQLAHPALLHPHFASPLFPRLPIAHTSPYGTLGKAMSAGGYIHAPPPPLLSAIPIRPASPRRTTPLTDRNLDGL